jgi:hypothetical protein
MLARIHPRGAAAMCDVRAIVLKTYLSDLERQAAPKPRPLRRRRIAPGAGLVAALRRAAARLRRSLRLRAGVSPR